VPDQVSWKMAGHPRATIITWGGKSLVAVLFSRLVGGNITETRFLAEGANGLGSRITLLAL
jgi:hypothetical protein